MQIKFSDRETFEKAFDVIVSYLTRLSSSGDLDIEYSDMTFGFTDVNHFNRAIERLEEKQIKDYEKI